MLLTISAVSFAAKSHHSPNRRDPSAPFPTTFFPSPCCPSGLLCAHGIHSTLKSHVMLCFELCPTPARSQDRHGFVGGRPSLPAGSAWPSCRMCGDDLVHFFTVELPDESRPFEPGSRLQVFACREHDDIAGTIYSEYQRFGSVAISKQLPEQYWDITDGHHLLRLLVPDESVIVDQPERRLVLQN